MKYLLFDCKDQHKNMPIDCEKNNGITPVFLSVQYNHLIILKMLKEAGANLQKTLTNKLFGGIDILYIAA